MSIESTPLVILVVDTLLRRYTEVGSWIDLILTTGIGGKDVSTRNARFLLEMLFYF
jgi:hypothetical protein